MSKSILKKHYVEFANTYKHPLSNKDKTKKIVEGLLDFAKTKFENGEYVRFKGFGSFKFNEEAYKAFHRRLDKRLAEGKLTQEKYDEIVNKYKERYDFKQ